MVLLRISLAFMAICCFISAPKPVKARRLLELPTDVLQLFFENLKTSDLINVFESNDALRDPVIYAFRHNHGHKLIKISGSFFFLGKMYSSSSFGIDEDYLDIQNFEMTLKILRTFGSAVTLRDTELNSLLTAPFPNVQSASFAVGHLKKIDLNRIFPKMHKLTIHSIISTSAELIDRHFPHLNDLTIDFFDETGLDEHDFESMLQKNPQITAFTADHCSLTFLEILHETLPRLQSLAMNNLQLDLFSAGNTVVRFESVKKFTLQVNYPILLTPHVIPFEFGDDLQEVILVWSHFRLGDQWTAFIERNTNIQKLTVHYSTLGTDYAYLTQLNLHNLKEFTLRSIDLIAEGEIDNLFSNINNWKKLETINFLDVSKSHIDVLWKHNGTWKVTEFENEEDPDILVDIQFDKIVLEI